MYFQELCEAFPPLGKLGFHVPPQIDGTFVLRYFGPHEIIHQKGSKLETIGILLEGSFRVFNELENGNLFMIEINDPFSFTGEITLLAGQKITSVTLETITECRIAFLTPERFDLWLHEDIRFLRYVSERIAGKLYLTSYSRGERMFYSSKYILLKYILDACEESDSGTLIVRKTRQQICEEIGLSVNSINRILNEFRQEGLVVMNHGKITMGPGNHVTAAKALKVYMSQNRNGIKRP